MPFERVMEDQIFLPSQVRSILDRLTRAGHDAYLVGGYLRDLYLGRKSQDLDLASSASPQEAMALFPDYRVIPTGMVHGTISFLTPEGRVEHTTFRKEGPYSDFRRPDHVSFTQSVEEDLARRDFTMNAMAYQPEKGLIDPWAGRQDLDRKLVRAVGDPDRRFKEDALRIMRALRFASQLDFDLEEETRVAMMANRQLLLRLAPERVMVELEALLLGPAVGRILRDQAAIWGILLPELDLLRPLEEGDRRRAERIASRVSSLDPDPVLRLAALFFDVHMTSTALAALRRLRFSQDRVKGVESLLEARGLEVGADRASVWRAIRLLGREDFEKSLLLSLADVRAQSPSSVKRENELQKIRELAAQLDREGRVLTLADLAVKGDDLFDLGLKGPQIGQALEVLLEKVCLGDLANQKEALLRSLLPPGEKRPD